MRKRLVSLIALGISISMFTGVASGCGKRQTTQPAANTTAVADVKKPEKITIMLDTGVVKENGQEQFAEEFKKQTGIELKIIQPAHNQYYEKLDLSFSSGEIPDIVQIGDNNLTKYASQGALLPLDKLIESSQNIKKIEKKYLDSEKVKGKVYGIPIEQGGGPVTYVRKDWLDNLNLKVPTTYDEFYNMLKAFAENDPDKNGKKDTIPLTAAGVTGYNYLREFYQNAAPDFILKDGKYVDGMAQPEMKAALQRLNQAYKEGLIDKEIVTNKTSTSRDKWAAGKVGVFSYWAGNWNQLLDVRLKAGPEGKTATMIPIAPIKETKYQSRVPSIYAITSKCSNPEGVFKYFMDFMYDGGKGQILFTHGVEGVHWENKDGKLTHKPLLSNPKESFDKAFITPALSLNKITDTNYKFDIDPRISSSLELLNKNSIQDSLLPLSKTLNKANADLVALREEVLSKVMLGTLSVDDGLAKYAKDSKALGVDQILTELNENK